MFPEAGGGLVVWKSKEQKFAMGKDEKGHIILSVQ